MERRDGEQGWGQPGGRAAQRTWQHLSTATHSMHSAAQHPPEDLGDKGAFGSQHVCGHLECLQHQPGLGVGFRGPGAARTFQDVDDVVIIVGVVPATTVLLARQLSVSK